jgi:hypothetical protein
MACKRHRHGMSFPDHASLIRSHICLQVLISLPVYAFYARRIRVLGGRLWMCFAVIILGLTHFTLAIVFSTKLIVSGDVSALASQSNLVRQHLPFTPEYAHVEPGPHLCCLCSGYNNGCWYRTHHVLALSQVEDRIREDRWGGFDDYDIYHQHWYDHRVSVMRFEMYRVRP